jgi:hypothetical protein
MILFKLTLIVKLALNIPIKGNFNYTDHGDNWQRDPLCYKKDKAIRQSPIDVQKFEHQNSFDEAYFFPSYNKLNVRAQFNSSLLITPEDYTAYSGDLHTILPGSDPM